MHIPKSILDNPELIRNVRAEHVISNWYPYLWAIIRNQGPYWIETDYPICGITTGYGIYINRNGFAMMCESEEVDIDRNGLLIYLLIHESLHLAYRHFKRMGDRHRMIWNVACDIAIDYDISHCFINMGYTKPLYDGLIKNMGISEEFAEDIPSMTTEEIYDRLISEKPQVKPEQMQSMCGVNRAKLTEGENPEIGEHFTTKRAVEECEQEQRHKAIADSGASGANDKKSQQDGEIDFAMIPGEVIRKIHQAQFGTGMPWKRILADVTQDRTLDNGYIKPDRRFEDVYIPDVYLEECPVNITIAVDTSSSINEKKLSEFVKYLNEINQISRNSEITIIICDMVVHGVYNIREFDQAKHLQGGGNTLFGPVFEHIDDKKCDVLIYFTDTDCQDHDWWWNKKHDYETIWAIPTENWRHRLKELYGRHLMIT